MQKDTVIKGNIFEAQKRNCSLTFIVYQDNRTVVGGGEERGVVTGWDDNIMLAATVRCELNYADKP